MITERPVIVCCGPGGVGKTTVSAALGLEAARRGRRACVVTVDPARRLADALGIESLANTPSPVVGDWPGHLDALMLDARGTFDDLVGRYSQTEEQAASILSNRLYQSLAGALSGTQEYMAMEKLYELTEANTYDVVIVDTPPTRNALELLDAPSRSDQFLENRLFRCPPPPHQGLSEGGQRGHPCPAPDDLSCGRVGDRHRRRDLFSSFPRHGGGVPQAGVHRA